MVFLNRIINTNLAWGPNQKEKVHFAKVSRAAFHQNSTPTKAPFDWKTFFKHYKASFRAGLPELMVICLVGGAIAGYVDHIEEEKEKAQRDNNRPQK